jgi:rubrerythrin
LKIKDRIKGLRRVKASELRPHAKNWRMHPPAQQEALRGILAEVGYVDALIARELKDGSLELIDGHLRAEMTPDTKVPVLVVDLSDKEAEKVLATLDPLAAMAERDQAKLDELLGDIRTNSEALTAMFQNMTGKTAEALAPTEFKSFDETIDTSYCCPKCGYKWSGSTGATDPENQQVE